MSTRLHKILGHLNQIDSESHLQTTASKSSLSVVDNRDGKSYEIEIQNGMVPATAFKKLRIYDPGFMNTASGTSRITYINGDKGILRYRGIPIEILAEKSSFLEVSYLLMYGELPNQSQLSYWNSRIMAHTFVHEDLKTMMKSFRYDAHPMGMLIATVSAMSTFYPEANPALQGGVAIYDDRMLRNKQIHRIIGTIATISAFAYRHRIGRPYIDPSISGLSYCENFLYMLDCLTDKDYHPHPALVKALNVLFILHADHEFNCSTTTMRTIASSGADVYSCIAGAAAALYGPSHGGANEAVLRMLEKIGTKDKIPQFLEDVKAKRVRLMGFGHRVYKNYDPRAKLVRAVANEVFAVLGKEPLIEVAMELERIALSEDYFIERKLYPNVDFYSGAIYKAMGFPPDFYPVLFAIPRTVGWLAHWNEFLDDPENKIVRPRQKYLGSMDTPYVPLNERPSGPSKVELRSVSSTRARRREAGISG